MFIKSFPALIFICMLSACVTSPTGRSQFVFMPEAEIDQMGLQAFDTLKKQKPISNNSKYNQLANCIAGAITKETGGNCEVLVFEDKSPNGFAYPTCQHSSLERRAPCRRKPSFIS
jgi:hypothetical protein